MKKSFAAAATLPGALVLFTLAVLAGCAPAEDGSEGEVSTPESPTGAIPVELVQRDGRYMLLRDGEPYFVKGAGLEFGDPEALAAHGGNSFRTWRTDNGVDTGQEVLDRAHRLGLTVSMCIEIGRERHGFDYDDEEAVAAQFEYARGEVLKYKDHPALLTWIIGNEPNLFATNNKVFDAVNDISKMIHEIDGKHPTTTALAGFGKELAELMNTRAADVDFVSIQMYGDVVNLPRYLEEIGWDKPYIVSEWGAIGHWEVGKTAWEAPVEQNSSAKADNYLKSHEIAIASDPVRLIGSYVFLWGQKQERTPTWYGMFLEDGTETETVDVMHKVWNGEWPENRSPRVTDILLGGRNAHQSVTLAPGQGIDVAFSAEDPDGDPLTFLWEVMRESEATQTGGDKEEIPEAIPGLVEAGADGAARLTAPTEPGKYRLFAYVTDGKGHAGHANIPFLVK